VLPPPYRTLLPLESVRGADDLPLGSIAVGRGQTTIAVLAELTAVVLRWPWVVPCLAMPAGQESLEPLLMLVTELRARLAIAREGLGAHGDEFGPVLAAVRRRSFPAPQPFAEWVARRLGDRELQDPLCDQFRQVLEGIPASGSASISTFSRIFARHGRYTARDWRAIARLCAHAAPGPERSERSTVTLPLRTASHYTRKYLDVPYRLMAERLGWEWVVEAALRTGGYV
jgi:hypothetical protein